MATIVSGAYVREAGTGPAVVCVHASASSSAQWRPLMDRLASRFRTLAVDLYGSGKSSRWPNDRTLSLADQFAFPEERKEPLTDARHVRNAIARFDQVEGVSDAERDKAWRRIKAAAKRYDIEVEADDWHDLFKGGKAKKR